MILALQAQNLLSYLQFLKVVKGEIWTFDTTRGKVIYIRIVLGKVIPDIDFTDETVVQCDVPGVKIIL